MAWEQMSLRRELYALARLSSVLKLFATMLTQLWESHQATLHHTTQSSEKDEKLIIDELMEKSPVLITCQEELIIPSPLFSLALQKLLMQAS